MTESERITELEGDVAQLEVFLDVAREDVRQFGALEVDAVCTIKGLKAQLAEHETFRSIACKMYSKQMLIVDGAVEYAQKMKAALLTPTPKKKTVKNPVSGLSLKMYRVGDGEPAKKRDTEGGE